MKLDIRPSFRGARVRYPAIVKALAEAIEKGKLRAGDRLPAQRDLAHQLDVAVGTVTRAYVELEKRGLVSCEVGRGTFVSRFRDTDPRPNARAAAPDAIDFMINRPPSDGCRQQFATILGALARRRDLAELLGHYPSAGLSRHRTAGAAWIGRTGWLVAPQQIVVCNGVQHGLSVVFAALSNPGDLVLTEELNYPGIKLLESTYHVRLQGLTMDEHGLSPEVLEEICQRERPRFLLVTPTVQNPTSTVMPPARRREIAAIAARHGIIVIEDDIYGLMPPTPVAPLSSLLPERSFYITGSSKCIGAGIRVGYIVAPEASVADIATAVQATTWMPTPLMAEILTTWIEDGTADKIVEWHRQEAAARQGLAARILKGCAFEGHAVGYHIWLHLPEPWRHEEFIAEARTAGVLIPSSDAFVIGRGVVPHAVRVSLGGPNERVQVEHGLAVLADVLAKGPQLRPMIV